MKKDDLFGLLLVVGAVLYVGGHVAWALLRPVLPALVSAMPK
jgi:hypothetical protein